MILRKWDAPKKIKESIEYLLFLHRFLLDVKDLNPVENVWTIMKDKMQFKLR